MKQGHSQLSFSSSQALLKARLGSERSRVFLHAFSGSDTVSAFSGIGKRTAWEIWQSAEVFQTLFCKLSDSPHQITDTEMNILERFVVLLYKRTSPLQSVNEARKKLFASGNRQIENIPPTRAALFQHAKRALFQAGHMWGKTLAVSYKVPSPTDWGWLKEARFFHRLHYQYDLLPFILDSAFFKAPLYQFSRFLPEVHIFFTNLPH